MQVSVIDLKEVNESSQSARIDADFFRKDYLDNIKKIKSKNHDILSNLVSNITDGEHGSPDWDPNSSIKYITAENIKSCYIEETEFNTISENQNNRNSRAKVLKDDVLFYSVGVYAGFAAKAEPHLFPANIPRSVAIIRTKKDLDPDYLAVFLNCKYGYFQSERLRCGNAQPMLALENISSFITYLPTSKFQKKIAELNKLAYESRIISKIAYNDAEEVLMTELGLKNWKPKHALSFVRNFSETIQTSRLDADFYQLKYDEIINHIKIKKIPIYKLNDLSVFINHGKQPPYIENGTIPVFSQKWIKDKTIDYSFVDEKNEPKTSEEFAKGYSKYVCKKHDILHYSVGANIGYCHAYLSDIKIMPGSFITLIRPDVKKINPIYLGLLLNSFFGRLQSEKRKSGTAQPYIYPSDLKEFFIPTINASVQNKIALKIIKSFEAREHSKKLLDIAKNAVEIAIENDEEIAFDFITNQEIKKEDQ